MQITDGVAAIVTGGSSGLGAATVALLRRRGARVAAFDVNPADGAHFMVDVTDEASVTEGLAAAEALHGPARILVNCAGIAPPAKTVGRENAAHPLSLFRKVIDINLIGTFNIVSQFAARLAALDPVGEERGVIVNTASVAAFDGQVGQAAYAASKAGVAGLTLPVARDLAQHRIRVMAIAPGLFLTPMLEGLPEAAQQSLGQQVPHPSRLGRPEEFAALVETIIANPMLNGEVIRLDGAIRMAPR